MQRPDVQAKLRRSHVPHSEETKVRTRCPLKIYRTPTKMLFRLFCR